MKKLIALLMALAMMVAMVACANEPDSTTTTQNPQTTNSTQSDSTAPSTTQPQQPTVDDALVEYYLQKANEVIVNDDSVTFTDDSGKGQITVNKNPQNVAVLFASLTCLWHEAGGEAQMIIGGKSAVTLYKEQIGHDITQDEDVTVVSESSTASEWDVEAIIARKPDLIVCSAGGKKGYETIAPIAEAAEIPVIAIEYNSVQDYLKWFKVFCNLSGHPEKWEQIANATAQKIIDVASKVPENTEKPKVAILVVVSGKIRAYGTQSAPGTIMEELGGVNVLDDGSDPFSTRDVDMEQLYVAAPDIILISARSSEEDTQKQLLAVVGEDPVWNSLQAVKNGVIYLEKGLFHNKPNSRYEEAYLTMAKILYPDVFQDR